MLKDKKPTKRVLWRGYNANGADSFEGNIEESTWVCFTLHQTGKRAGLCSGEGDGASCCPVAAGPRSSVNEGADLAALARRLKGRMHLSRIYFPGQ